MSDDKEELVSSEKAYTIPEAADATGLSKKAISGRMDRGTLLYWIEGWGDGRSRRVRMVSEYELRRKGLFGDFPENQTDRIAKKVIQFLSTRPGLPFSTFQLRLEGSLGAGEPAARQPVEVVLSTLRALGYVTKNVEPPPGGGGRPRDVWTWVGPPSNKLSL
jgi:hypothetical protein